jgi:hypothetical protein
LFFSAVESTHSRTLSREQIEQFNRDGFVGPLALFEGAEVERVREYIGRLVDEAVAAPDQRDSYSINAYHPYCQGLYDLTQSPLLLDYVEDLLGPNFVCWGTTVFCKLPGDPKEVPLHQDAAYWPFTPTKSVTAWLAIDDADEENGAMEFVLGSHLGGAVDHADLPLDGTRVNRREVVGARTYTARYSNNLAAGQVSLHSDLLLHGSPPNLSKRRRAGLTIRYAAGEVRALPEWEWWYGSAVHCRGDVPDWWPHRKRPTGEHPELMAAFTAKYGGNLPGNR